MGIIKRISNWLLEPTTERSAPFMSEKIEMINEHNPLFTSFKGEVYETELIRSVIHAKAKHTAKLSPHVVGSAKKNFENTLKHKPNKHQSTYDFLYKLRTLYEVDTYAFIVPLYARDQTRLVGLYPLKASGVEIIDLFGRTWLRYKLANGEIASIEYERVGILKKMNYNSQHLGDGNNVLQDTMTLLDLQSQGIQDAIRQSAKIRFIAKIGQNLNPEDLEKERAKFTEQNLSSSNKSNVMMFDNKYLDVKQIDSDPYVANDETIEQINQNIFSYWGINQDILQNKFDENTWNAFYEGEIEPFAIQLSQALTNMLFTSREKAEGNVIHFSANRLQYASNTTKLEVSTRLFDRGIFGTHDVADIWNMPKTGENTKYIRKEYAEMEKLGEDKITQVEIDEEIDKEVDKVKEAKENEKH